MDNSAPSLNVLLKNTPETSIQSSRQADLEESELRTGHSQLENLIYLLERDKTGPLDVLGGWNCETSTFSCKEIQAEETHLDPNDCPTKIVHGANPSLKRGPSHKEMEAG
jgi:hypothetical protein